MPGAVGGFRLGIDEIRSLYYIPHLPGLGEHRIT